MANILKKGIDYAVGKGKELLGAVSGAEAAEAQSAAAAQAAAWGREDLKQAAASGQGIIDATTATAQTKLLEGTTGGLSSLRAGSEKAAGELGGAENRLSDLYGGGLAAGFEEDPGYQFRRQQGEDAINRNFAASGGRGGGDAMKAIAEYGQNFASNEFDRYAQRQMGLASGADQGDWRRRAGLADLYSGTGAQEAGIMTGTGTSLANLFSGAGVAQANLGIGAAGQAANLSALPVQYAGGGGRAQSEMLQQLTKLGLAAATG